MSTSYGYDEVMGAMKDARACAFEMHKLLRGALSEIFNRQPDSGFALEHDLSEEDLLDRGFDGSFQSAYGFIDIKHKDRDYAKLEIDCSGFVTLTFKEAAELIAKECMSDLNDKEILDIRNMNPAAAAAHVLFMIGRYEFNQFGDMLNRHMGNHCPS